MECNLSRVTLEDDIKESVSYAKKWGASKHDQVRLVVNAIFARHRVLDARELDKIAKCLGVTVPYFQKAVRSIPNVGLAYNGTRHYRFTVSGPVKRWSMCVYKPESDEGREDIINTLERKGYGYAEESVPLPFEYVKTGDGAVCWLEPCDSESWSKAYHDHIRRKTNLQEVQPENHHEEWEEDHYLLEVLLRSLKKRCSIAEGTMAELWRRKHSRDEARTVPNKGQLLRWKRNRARSKRSDGDGG